MQDNKSSALDVVVLLGSVREGRQGIHLANLVVAKLKARGHTVTLIDAEKEKLPILEKPYHHYKDSTTAPEQLQKLAKILEKAQGFVVVDGEYNHGPTPGILNLLDHFYHGQYKFKVAGLAMYSGGPMGGARSAYVLRNTLGELSMITIPTIFNLPLIWSNKIKDNAFTEKENDSKLDKFLNELEFFTNAISAQKVKGLPQ